MLLDVRYRRRLGESPGISDYRRRFPELDGTRLDAEEAPARGRGDAARVADGPETECYRGDPGSPPRSAGDGEVRRLGKFQLLERVGVGGFETVWRARDVRLNRIVALRIPHAHPIEPAEEVARFYGEVRAAAQLRHPGIVTVHEVAALDGPPILVCDFVAGQSLRDVLRAR